MLGLVLRYLNRTPYGKLTALKVYRGKCLCIVFIVFDLKRLATKTVHIEVSTLSRGGYLKTWAKVSA